MKLLCFCCVWWMASGATCKWVADADGPFDMKCQTPPEYTQYTSAEMVDARTCMALTVEADCKANSKCEFQSARFMCLSKKAVQHLNSAAYKDGEKCHGHSNQSTCVADTKCGWVTDKIDIIKCIIKADADAYDATHQTQMAAAAKACHDANANQAACEAVQFQGPTTTAAPTTANTNGSSAGSSVRVADVMVSSLVLAGAVAVQTM